MYYIEYVEMWKNVEMWKIKKISDKMKLHNNRLMSGKSYKLQTDLIGRNQRIPKRVTAFSSLLVPELNLK